LDRRSENITSDFVARAIYFGEEKFNNNVIDEPTVNEDMNE